MTSKVHVRHDVKNSSIIQVFIHGVKNRRNKIRLDIKMFIISLNISDKKFVMTYKISMTTKVHHDVKNTT